MRIPEPPPLRPVPPDSPPAARTLEGPEVEPGLREYAASLLDRRWLILAFVAAGLIGGAFRWLTATPVFRSDAVVQVERTNRGMSTLEELAPSNELPSETEIEIIRSRFLLGTVVDSLDLQISAQPRWFPIVGAAIARRHTGSKPASAWLGFSRYAWGGERIDVRRLDLPERIVGASLRLVALQNGSYRLQDAAGALLVQGEVGKAASGTTTNAEGGRETIDVFIAQLRARPGTEFQVTKQPRAAVVGALQASMRVVERGQRTGVLQILFDGPDSRRVAAIVDAIANAYLRQNVERRSAEAQKTLEFLNTQLPILKGNVETAEAALNEFRARRGKVDLALESSAMLQQAVDVEQRLQELEFQRTEMRQRFTENHPAYIVLRQKLSKLQEEKAAIEGRIKTLPEAELQVARLTRDVQVANNLYTLLLNRSQELKVVKSGTVGNVRILDTALPGYPVGSSAGSTLALGAVLGLLAGSALALALRAFGGGVQDPDAIERALGLSVYASVSHSERQAELAADFRHGKITFLPPLAVAEPNGLAIEGIRSLRTSLQFALAEAHNNVIAILGPSPNVGKSFLAVNIALVLGDTGARVLLVDADLRNGHLHHYFGVERSPGVSEVAAGTLPVENAARRKYSTEVDLLSTGKLPPNPAEVLASGRFRELIEAVTKKYDFVVVDTPPVLAVTDAAVIGRSCGVNLLVLESGKHQMREIAATLKSLAHGGIRPNGAILNSVDYRSKTSRRYHYQYSYTTAAKHGR